MKKYPCPCCDEFVYDSPANGDYSICPICQWEDDPVQFEDSNYGGGANPLSLNEARRVWQKKKLTLSMRPINPRGG